MKYIQKTTKTITENFSEELLIDRNILNKNQPEYNYLYFRPNKEVLYPSIWLDNMEEGFQMFKRHLENGSKILLIIDPDVDGYTSSAVLYNYIINSLLPLYPNIQLSYHVPEGKEHGFRSLMDIFDTSERICDLILVPDAGSNDYEQHRVLKEQGYDILCLDHHETTEYSQDAVVINNQLSDNYENKNLSGVGIVYKFLQYCDSQLNLNAADDYLDLVALGNISDMMEMTTLENRFICEYGLSHINNKFFQDLLNKQSYSLGEGDLTQIGVAFYITPLINALIRVGSQVEKENLFKAFIEPDTMIPSTKRGEKGLMETISTQSVRNCVNAKSRQNREKEKAMELLDIQILENCLDENKIIILNADELNVSNTLTGLIAMGVSAKYKKPVILGRTTSDGYLKGSARGRGESELKDFRQFLLDSKLMDFAQG